MSSVVGRGGTHSRRRAIVTGGAGFIGSHLVDRLVADGTAVLVIDDLSSGHVENLAPEASLECLDVARAELGRLFRHWRPGIVFHLAAQASVPLSARDPIHDLDVNVLGTHRVTAASRDAGAARLVFASSGGAVYGELRRPATEFTRPAPSSYYGIHKLAAEGHVMLGGLPYAVARPSNVYGPRQVGGLEGAVVATFIDQAMRQGELRIDGTGSQTRDFVHVQDVVAALCLLAATDTPTGIWNVASGRATSILDLAGIVERALSRPLGRLFGPPRPGDVLNSVISAARLRRLGWRPTTSLPDGVRQLIESAGRPSIEVTGAR